MGRFEREADVVASPWSGPLFDGSLGRAVRIALALILTVWFAYDNPLDLAYVYVLPLTTMIGLVLYPTYLSTISMMWMLMVPYTLLRLLYVSAISTIVSHLLDEHGWSEAQVRWIPLSWYFIVSLTVCQARVCLGNKLLYGMLLSAQYIFDNAFFPFYMLSIKGTSFIADAKMIALLRAVVVDLASLTWLPANILDFLHQLATPQCDHLFGKTSPPAELLREGWRAVASGDRLSDMMDWTVLPNQACRIPVPLLFRSIGGVFEASKSHIMTVSTDSAAQFVRFLYRPGSEYFFSTIWVAAGEQGIFRGMLLSMLLASAVTTTILLTRPAARTRYLLKCKLIDYQRRLYKTSAGLMEAAGLITGEDRLLQRLCLVSFPPPTRLSRLPFTSWLFRGSLPPNDLDNLPSRIQDLTALVNSATVESGIAQSPGLQSAPALGGLLTVLTHEAASLGATARALSISPAESWHHPVGHQMITGQCQIRTFEDSSEASRAWARDVFLTYYRVCELVERSLSVDEVCGRDRGSTELLSELRHSTQLELKKMQSLLQEYPAVCGGQRSAMMDHVAATFGFVSIEKCKACVVYLEGEREKDIGKWISGTLVSVFGPALTFSRGVMLGWKDVFRGGRAHPNACPEKELVIDDHNGVYKSERGAIALWQNAEVWTGFRFLVGEFILFAVFLFNLDFTETVFLDSQKDHLRSSKLLGGGLSIDESVIKAIAQIFPPSNNGAGMSGNVPIIPNLFWADVGTVKLSKFVIWSFLGYYCSNLITYQGTVKRSFLRFTAMLISTGIAWVTLYVTLNYAGGETGNTNSAFALEDETTKFWTIFTITVIGCVLTFIGVICFASPFNRRFAFDTQVGYFGQILTYHFLVVTFGLCWDPRQTRDELCLVRIMGHAIGTCLSLILTFVIFPVDANTQQKIRIAGTTVALRRSFIALNKLTTAHASQDVWLTYLDQQMQLSDHELSHYVKILEDSSICDTVGVLLNDKILLEMGDILRQKHFQRGAARKLIENLAGTKDVFERDATFKAWVELNTPAPSADPKKTAIRKDHSELQHMRARYAGPQPLRPASPYAFYSDGDDSGEEQSGTELTVHRRRSPFSPRRRRGAPTPPLVPRLAVENHLDSPTTTERLSQTAATTPDHEVIVPGPDPTDSSTPAPLTYTADDLKKMQKLWICVEFAVLRMGKANFDRKQWNFDVDQLIAQLDTRVQTQIKAAAMSDGDRLFLIQSRIWEDELISIRRMVAYVNEFCNVS